MRRAFLSGFKGSAGTAVVTPEKALLWTDSRYWNEAGSSLDTTCWTLMKAGLPETPKIPSWVAEHAVSHFSETNVPLRVGLDPYVHSASFVKELKEAFQNAAKEEFNDEDIVIGEIEIGHGNLVDKVWGDARPPVPTSPFTVHPLKYAGCSMAEKLEKIREEMKSKKASMSVFCTLDDVAYLFNVRAQGDVETCPVGIAYGTVTADEACLYCDPKKLVLDETKDHLKGVTLKPYDDIVSDISSHCENPAAKVWLDKSHSNYAISSAVPAKQLVDSQNAIVPMKACKNEAELEGMRQAHIVDGVAMANFISWLEKQIVEENRSVSEVEIDQVLNGCRAAQPGFKEPSFPTIAGVGPNGAIVHYRASAESKLMKSLDKTNPILIDSGGQYEYGTTDVTRTWHFGDATEEFKDYYTCVLKGHIGVDSAVFPENTPGFVLDVYAREWLWKIKNTNYGHGTGHGVGAALNVHEGPMSISPRWSNTEPLKGGMVLSNEPGFYEDGKFGIRIENLLEVIEIPTSGDKKFFKFGRLTMIPIQKNLINLDLMTTAELDWLDSYHEEVWTKVSPLLEDGSDAKKWLEKMCAKIERN